MKKKNPKYIFVVGGVISGVGKGIAASSIGKILEDRGVKATAVKIDPYVNLDAGTMNPTEHGEVFVLDDGDETDQDMGNYERFLETTLTGVNYMTTGRIYQSVIDSERKMGYGGKCVQVVPHIPLEVVRRITAAQKKAGADVVVIEIGGTVGEYENILFLEAARMMKIKNPEDILVVMVSYLPIPNKVGEMKTKPTQHAVRTLNSSGLQPDIIIARSDIPLDAKRKEKIAYFCNVPSNHVISAPDIESIYDVPMNFEKENLSQEICNLLHLKIGKKTTENAKKWKEFARRIHRAKDEVKIAIIGKYFDTGDFTLSDSYLSVIEAVKYSAFWQNKKPVLTWLNSLEFEKNPKKVKELSHYDGIIVPGGFGSRGIEGKINVIKYARENKIPYFGLCYGMQLMVIEYARNVLGLKDATSLEINPKSKNLVITVMEGQVENLKNARYGGSMRLGGYKCALRQDSIALDSYNAFSSSKLTKLRANKLVTERHRHRFEVNNDYVENLEKEGLVFSGKSPNGKLMEIAELPKKIHPFFLGTQFHPEFLAHPLRPHPLFGAFIKAATTRKKSSREIKSFIKLKDLKLNK